MPVLNWIGKDSVVNHDKKVPFRLLKKVESDSVGENSQNLIIHGDNLEALKALMPFYYGKVNCIYIDPPYNTGNESWVYNDKVNSPKIKQWLGKVVGRESEDLTRHDKWLCMMYPRLKLLKDLLAGDGVIFISIDDNEYPRLIMVMEELFGENNLKTICVKMSEATGVKMASVIRNGRIPKLKEYLVIAKMGGINNLYLEKLPKEKWDDEYNKIIINATENQIDSIREIRDNESRTSEEVLKCNQIIKDWEYLSLTEYFKNENINIKEQEVFKYENAWRIIQIATLTGGARNIAKKQKKSFKELPSFFSIVTPQKKMYLIRGDFNSETILPRCKLLFADDYLTIHPGDFWQDIKTTGLDNEGGISFKNGKKPLRLIERIIKTNKNKHITVLDSFAGSGTTGHAVLDLNKADGGDRKFILVELEDYVAKDITAERVKQAIKKYGYKDGFEYCELDKPLFNEKGQIEDECSFNQFATYIYFTETQTNIDVKEIKGNYIGGSEDASYYLIYKGKNKNDLNKPFLKNLDKDGKKKVIYADRCLIDEDLLFEYNIVFKQIPYEVKVY